MSASHPWFVRLLLPAMFPLAALAQDAAPAADRTASSDVADDRSATARNAAADAAPDEVIVTATRTARRLDEVPASASVIGAESISRQHVGKVQDLLKNVESVDFNEVPAAGGASVPQIRGIGGSFAGSTSAVLVDGMPTDSSISGVLGRGGLNFLAVQDIERIEVLRGPASALYGPNVVGGVVNVIPKRWSGAPGVETYVEVGPHNARSLGAATGYAGPRFDVRISGSDFRTDGYIAKPEADPWGEKDLAPRAWQDRKWNLSGGMRPGEHDELTFAYQRYRTPSDVVGGRPNYRQHHEGDAYVLGYRYRFANDNAVQLKYRRNELRQAMPWDDEAWNGTTGSYILAATWYRQSDSDTIELQTDWHPLSDNTLTIGASYLDTDFATGWHDVLYDETSRSTATAKSTGVFIQDEHRAGPLTLVAGGRYDRIKQGASTKNGAAINDGAGENTFNPRAGLRYHLAPTTSLYVSVGTAFVPASADLKYVGNPTRFVDNPDLKPETSTTYEVGFRHELAAAAELRVAAYRTFYKDQISAHSVNGDSFWPRQYINIGRVVVDGVELGIHGRLPHGWIPYANYSYTDSVIRKNPDDPDTVGKRTQRIAPHKLNAGLSYVPDSKWDLNVNGRYVGERYFDNYNTDDHRAGGYVVGDARLNLRLIENPRRGCWETYLAVNNIFNRRYVVWEYEYADERTLSIGVNARF